MGGYSADENPNLVLVIIMMMMRRRRRRGWVVSMPMMTIIREMVSDMTTIPEPLCVLYLQ